MQPVGIDFRIVAYHVRQRRKAAVVHVRRGTRHVAQRWHLELAEIAVRLGHLPRLDGARAAAIIVVAAQQI